MSSFTQSDYYLINDQLLQWLSEANKRCHHQVNRAAWFCCSVSLPKKLARKKKKTKHLPQHATPLESSAFGQVFLFILLFRLPSYLCETLLFMYRSFVLFFIANCSLHMTLSSMVTQKFGYKKAWCQMEPCAVDIWINQRNHLPSSSNHEVPSSGEYLDITFGLIIGLNDFQLSATYEVVCWSILNFQFVLKIYCNSHFSDHFRVPYGHRPHFCRARGWVPDRR